MNTISWLIAAQILLISVASGQTVPEAQKIWQDPVTHTIWATSDNGVGVSWSQAVHYCKTLSLGGYQDWTLPSIDDLQTLVSPSSNPGGFRIAGPIKLTGWAWSSSPGVEPGEGWALDFGDGGRASVVAGDSGLNRALCRRAPSKPARENR